MNKRIKITDLLQQISFSSIIFFHFYTSTMFNNLMFLSPNLLLLCHRRIKLSITELVQILIVSSLHVEINPSITKTVIRLLSIVVLIFYYIFITK